MAEMEEYEVYRDMAVNKLAVGELDEGTLDRIVRHIYEVGYFYGREANEKYKGETK